MEWRATRGQQWALLLMVLCVISATAVGDDLPPGVTVIQAEDVVRLAREHKELILIDSRSPGDRDIGAIEGSISLPDEHTNCDTLSRISRHLEQPLIFYCNGVKCGRSRVAVQIASSCGYTNVYWFKGGYEEWREKHFPVLKSQ